jgi:hypothetical protein
MIPRTIADYSGPKADARPIKDPTTQVSADDYNKLANDAAQVSRTVTRARCEFLPANPPAIVSAGSIWGNGNAQRPSIQRLEVGRYQLTYPTALPDELGANEAVSFVDAQAPTVKSTSPAFALMESVNANVAIVRVFDGTGALSDTTGARVTVRLD